MGQRCAPLLDDAVLSPAAPVNEVRIGRELALDADKAERKLDFLPGPIAYPVPRG